jgi:hypothetical protein
VDCLLVAAIWTGTSPATFTRSDSGTICGSDVGSSPFVHSPRLDRKNDFILCGGGDRLIGPIRSRTAFDNLRLRQDTISLSGLLTRGRGVHSMAGASRHAAE